MKQLLITIAAVLVVGCGESQSPEPSTAKAPDISIHEAASDGDIEAVKQYLASGADVNAKQKGWMAISSGMTVLHVAAFGGQNEIAELLIAKGADVNAKDDRGGTPLHRVVYVYTTRKKEIVELLITKGAEVNAKDGYGRTPLHEAKTKEIAELLIAEGADVTVNDKRGRTPLHEAHNKEIAELLIAEGADVNAKSEDDFRGTTPLDAAIRFRRTRNR